MPSRDKLSDFTAWCAKQITGDEKGEAQIFLGRLIQAFGQSGSLDEIARIASSSGKRLTKSKCHETDD